ncbi:MAG: hypothetical protein ABI675_15070 [Chitinophagaceae bacterium]
MGKHKTKQYYDEAGLLIIKPYRLKDLAAIFDVRENTLKRWMSVHKEELNKNGRQYYTVQQVQLMIEKFGLPQKLNTQIPIRLNHAA